jgi:urease accessory protein
MSAAPLLHLLWLASPALPVGGFSYSEGLEAAIEAGRVGDEASAGHWLVQQLELVLARSELPLLVQAHAAWQARPDSPDRDHIAALQAWHLATRETAELRAQSEQMGRSLVDWLRNSAWAADDRIDTLATLAPAPAWPLGFALATVLAGASARDAALAFAFGWAENMVQAAMKAVPLGQAAAQRMLAGLTDAIPPAVERALATPDDARQAFAPMLAILSAQHETQYSRLFRS